MGNETDHELLRSAALVELAQAAASAPPLLSPRGRTIVDASLATNPENLVANKSYEHPKPLRVMPADDQMGEHAIAAVTMDSRVRDWLLNSSYAQSRCAARQTSVKPSPALPLLQALSSRPLPPCSRFAAPVVLAS